MEFQKYIKMKFHSGFSVGGQGLFIYLLDMKLSDKLFFIARSKYCDQGKENHICIRTK